VSASCEDKPTAVVGQIVQSTTYPDRVSLRGFGGEDVRDRLTEAGYQSGDLVHICILCRWHKIIEEWRTRGQRAEAAEARIIALESAISDVLAIARTKPQNVVDVTIERRLAGMFPPELGGVT